jgi:membrane protein
MLHFNMLKKGKTFAVALRDSFVEFRENDALRMAAATSFFATFALPPILIILIEVFGFFGNPQMIRHDLLQQLSQAIDKNTVSQIRETLRNVRYLSLTWYTRAGGFIFLLFVATTLFMVISNSLNQLWKISRKKNNGVVFMLLSRAKSIGMIILAGVLFFIVVLADIKGGSGLFLKKIVYHAVSMLASVAWFILVFRFQADGRPLWRSAVAGGILTGLLFTLGKIVLHLLLSYGKVHTIYGSSTSIILLLLFIFYSAFIFYYGACFTRIHAQNSRHPILPTRRAMKYILKRIEVDKEN